MPEPSSARMLACTVALSEPLAAGMRRMRLHCPELAASIEPGQFFNLRVPGDATQLLRLPFSYAVADRAAGEVEFAFEVVGDGTRRLAALPVGTACDLLGPAGHGWSFDAGCSRALLVGEGKGVVALLALAADLRAAGASCDVVVAGAAGDALIYEDAFAELECAVLPATADGSRGFAGTCDEAACGAIVARAFDAVFACCPDAAMAKIAAAAAAAQTPCQVSMERLMACGFGACTTCLVDTVNGRKGACMDGPVFDAAEVLW